MRGLLFCQFAGLTLLFTAGFQPAIAAKATKPNIVLIFADDLGYQDLGCFGSEKIKTPNLDQMAKEGRRFTSFYAQTVCGPSRAALMTGCYPLRVAVKNNRVEVHPRLHSKEITIAEVLREAGYRCGAFGKWDLAGHTQTGFDPELLPNKQGFHYFFGTPSSNDSIVHLMRNQKMIEKNADMAPLTRRYTDEAIAFMKRNREQPFFVYLPHTMPHIRLEVTEEHKGKSAGGIYGDTVEEIDANVGRILAWLKEAELDENTIVMFMSDNGPWYLGRSKGHIKRIGPDAEAHGGLAGPLRGAKTSTWEGGLRVPCIMRWPDKIPAGTVCDEIASTLDMLPTLGALGGGSTPIDRVIDGHDIRDLMFAKEGATSPTSAYYYYRRTRLEAVRAGKWKLHAIRPAEKNWGHFSKAADNPPILSPMLFDLDADIGESTDVANEHPEVVARLGALLEKACSEIGDHNRIGSKARFFDPQRKRPDVKR